MGTCTLSRYRCDYAYWYRYGGGITGGRVLNVAVEPLTTNGHYSTVLLDGVTRDDLMAGHQSNHITVAYVDDDKLAFVLQAFCCSSTDSRYSSESGR